MALKDIYGIGKGSAQVVDLRPINAMVQSREEANIKRNEARAKQRSTMAAAINSQRDKLKNTAWREDRVYIDGLINDTKKWMSDTYIKHGEMALVDNPELKREWQEKIDFITQQNDTSAANIAMGDKMLIKSLNNIDDIDPESGIAFNKWMDLPPEERLRTPMKMIKDRELTLYEVMEEEGAKETIGQTYVPTGGTGLRDEETGRTVTYKGKGTNILDYNNIINKYSTNLSGRIFKKANRDAIKKIDQNLYPTHIEENGEKIPNPEYEQELNRVRKEEINREGEKFKAPDYTTTSASYSGKELEPSIVKVVSDEDAGYTSGELVKSDLGTEGTFGGNTYYQLDKPAYYNKTTGKGSQNRDDLKAEYGDDIINIPIGTWVDENLNQPSNQKDIKPKSSGTKYKVISEHNVSGSPTKTVTVDETISNDGSIKRGEGQSITGKLSKVHKKRVVMNGDKVLHKSQTGYKESESEVVQIATITKKDNSTIEVKVTPKIKRAYPKQFKEVDVVKPSKTTKESRKKSGKISGITWKK